MDTFETVMDEINEHLLAGNHRQVEILLNSIADKKLKTKQFQQLDRKWIRLLFSRGEFENALRRIKAYQKKYKLAQESEQWFEARCMEAFLNISTGRLKAAEQALETLEKATKHIPEWELYIRVNVGCLLRDSGKWNDAFQILTDVYKRVGEDSELSIHIALIIAEMFSDLQRNEALKWCETVILSAPRWAGWEFLKTAEILKSLELFRSNYHADAIQDLHRHLSEADQMGRIPPRLRGRMALAEVLLAVGDIESSREYLQQVKTILEYGGESVSRFYQPMAELLWLSGKCTDGTQTEVLEVLDRLEILLAVIAKYSRPPGPARFWLQIAHAQVRLDNPENALRAFRRAQAEAAAAGSYRLESQAILDSAGFEWSRLPETKLVQSPEKNRIFAATGTALERSIQSGSKELEWQVHNLRGKMFLASGEQYPADSEMHMAAVGVSDILKSIRDPGLRRMYREHASRSESIQSLQKYLDEIVIPQEPSDSGTVEIRSSGDAEETGNIRDLQLMLDALFDLYSSSSIEELLIRSLRHILLILNADRVQIQMDQKLGLNQFKYTGVKSQQEDSEAFSVPPKWIRNTRNINRSMIYIRDPDEEDLNRRSAICAPITYGGVYYGMVYADRVGTDNSMGKTEIEFVDTMLRAASASLSILLMRSRLNELTDQFRKDIVPQYPDIIGSSEAMKEVFVLIEKVASAEVPVLIHGETGTGKDLVAKTIHSVSPRKASHYVHLDCSAIPSTLIESELFGIEKGTATGVEPRVGLLEYANGGTVLLDEVADIPLDVQAKLLRVLQEREFEPVGSDRVITVDIRILSTTSKDIKSMIENRTVREDFYYRISGLTIRIPPLRERIGDVVILARSFLERYNAEFGKEISGFTRQALDAMDAYDWPGNVRELDHIVRKATLFAQGKRITIADLGIPGIEKHLQGLKAAVRDFQRKTAREVFASTGKTIEKTAELLGTSPESLRKLLK
ncbi:sigma 54-interacting transcriptional regulator [bacterium]|nr:sigma 54-interacting transcriptional regulator [candidate division CSSED10-310 bacterium]